jgi:hypothetical protein
MGKADLPLAALAVVGDEEQVVGSPGGAVGAVGGGALLERHLAQDAAQRHHRQLLRLELDEEDAPGLARRERLQALDFGDLGGGLRVDAKFVGGEVVEQIVHVLERVAGNRPAHLVAQVGDELDEALDVRQFGAVIGWHRSALVEFHPAAQRRLDADRGVHPLEVVFLMCFSILPRSSMRVFSSVVHLRGVSGLERMLATISPGSQGLRRGRGRRDTSAWCRPPR